MGRRAKIGAALKSLMNARGHHTWSLEELHAELGSAGVRADFSSVFRAMAKLEADGHVRRVELDDARTHFEVTTEHHDHLRCANCGEVAAVPCGPVALAIEQMEILTGFDIADHRLVLTGTCLKCQQPAPQSEQGSVATAAGGSLAGGIA
ncbi:MAG: Fur family transcriptional regulator [Candidatus Dormibacteria bacterium]